MGGNSCNPADWGASALSVEQTFGVGGFIHYEYQWDGISVQPECRGELNLAWARNNNPETWYAHFQGRRGTWKRITMAPGFDNSATPYTRNQLRQQGFEDNTDMLDLTISKNPNPPT